MITTFSLCRKIFFVMYYQIIRWRFQVLFGGGAPTPEFRPKPIITAHKRSLGQGNTFAPVCHSVHRGFCLGACWDSRLPGSRHPPGADNLPRGETSPAQCMLGDTANKRAVRILLECILVLARLLPKTR